jgi:hypothetical protein
MERPSNKCQDFILIKIKIKIYHDTHKHINIFNIMTIQDALMVAFLNHVHLLITPYPKWYEEA